LSFFDPKLNVIRKGTMVNQMMLSVTSFDNVNSKVS